MKYGRAYDPVDALKQAIRSRISSPSRPKVLYPYARLSSRTLVKTG